jgi:hypothetical protein
MDKPTPATLFGTRQTAARGAAWNARMICTQSAPMKPVPDLCGNSRRRALAAVGLASCCLERGLILAALASARAAARSTLLTLAAAPPRAADPDIQLLRELGSAPLAGLGLRPAAQEAAAASPRDRGRRFPASRLNGAAVRKRTDGPPRSC